MDFEYSKYFVENLQNEIAKKNTEIENWKDTAAQFLKNQEYYCSLLDKIAENFGVESYTSDDGSIQDSPLRIKMPELVKNMLAEKNTEIERLNKELELTQRLYNRLSNEYIELQERLIGEDGLP